MALTSPTTTMTKVCYAEKVTTRMERRTVLGSINTITDSYSGKEPTRTVRETVLGCFTTRMDKKTSQETNTTKGQELTETEKRFPTDTSKTNFIT